MRKSIKNIIITAMTTVVMVAAFTDCKEKGNNKTENTKTVKSNTLLENIKLSAEKGYMLGHHDATIYGIGWENEEGRSDVKSVCGDYPAVISFDLGHIEHKSEKNLDNVSFEKIRKEIINQYKRGGLISLSWHLDKPVT